MCGGVHSSKSGRATMPRPHGMTICSTSYAAVRYCRLADELAQTRPVRAGLADPARRTRSNFPAAPPVASPGPAPGDPAVAGREGLEPGGEVDPLAANSAGCRSGRG